jgi:hypothetical protein
MIFAGGYLAPLVDNHQVGIGFLHSTDSSKDSCHPLPLRATGDGGAGSNGQRFTPIASTHCAEADEQRCQHPTERSQKREHTHSADNLEQIKISHRRISGTAY